MIYFVELISPSNPFGCIDTYVDELYNNRSPSEIIKALRQLKIPNDVIEIVIQNRFPELFL